MPSRGGVQGTSAQRFRKNVARNRVVLQVFQGGFMRVMQRNRASIGRACSALATLLALVLVARGQYPSSSQVSKDGTTILLEDYATLPLSSPVSGAYPPAINYRGQIGRVNSLRSEPANAPKASSRFFVIDSSANLYILDKGSKTFTPYINFAEVFPKFDSSKGNAAGIVSLAFDPEYAKNGKFYTVHTEDPSKAGSAVATNSHLTALNVDGYM